ncbi:hypothetical protein HD554DRAFT_2326740 [Boletus coccyginus]|nr:hypothetical protein HD554DRAFT_2326740 [Boletus coccyginus]
MSGESPPPTLLSWRPLGWSHSNLPRSPETTPPFSHSDRLDVKILGLLSEGKTLDSRFKDARDVASAGAKFEYQETALNLCQRFETLVWESRNIAGIALVAVKGEIKKNFNELVLDFLSNPGVVAQDGLKELANVSKDFHRTIHSESDALIPERQRQGHSGGRGTGATRLSRYENSALADSNPGKWKNPVVLSRSESSSGLSTATKPDAAPLNPPERKRLCPAIERAEAAALFGPVDALVRELRAFASSLDVFNTVFAELARAQDIFVVYLRDGKSVANQDYLSEIHRLRGRLPCLCNALDAYGKARLS